MRYTILKLLGGHFTTNMLFKVAGTTVELFEVCDEEY